MSKYNKHQITIAVSTLIILLFFISTIIITFTSIIPYLLSLIQGGSDDRINAILSIIANITGGIIAGVVAYITAKYQIKKDADKDRNKELIVSLTELRFIREELKYNLKVFRNLSKSEDITDKNTYLKSHLKSKTWYSTNLNFVNEINDELLDDLFSFYTQINFIMESNDVLKEKHINSCFSSNNKTLNLLEDKIEELKNNL